jgi:hypothetical protein
MNMSDSKMIAQEIWSQMNAIDRNLVWCMGTNKPCTIPNGLQFNVQGSSFRGTVQITLNGADLYDICFIKNARKLNKQAAVHGLRVFDTHPEVVEKYENVFVSEMMDVLERTVESRR